MSYIEVTVLIGAIGLLFSGVGALCNFLTLKDRWHGRINDKKSVHRTIEDLRASPKLEKKTVTHNERKFCRQSVQFKTKHEISDDPLDEIEKEVGVLWSNYLNIPVRTEFFNFKGRLLAKSKEEYSRISTLYELYELYDDSYELYDDSYLVYAQSNHHFDYGTSYLAGAKVNGEEETPLTLAQVQNEFPTLATKAGLAKVTEISVKDA